MGMFSDIDYSLIVLQLEKAMANGVATLDSNTKVPKAQISLTASDVGAIASTGNEVLTSLNAASGTISSGLLPSYVDDVLSYTNLAGFPGTGETGKIYVDETTNKVYRWSGSVYVEISSSATAGEALKLTTPRTITTTGDASYSVSFDGSANVTSAITLATVNSNAGSFGSASSIPAITVNAKGQVTAVSTNSIGNELIAIQSLSDTPGFLKKTGDGTYSIDINSYLSLAGGTITGNLAVNGNIIGSLGAGVSLYQGSPLGSTSGDFQVLSSKTGASGNIITERTWLCRKANGVDWNTTSFHNGIAVDASFNIPLSTTRTWWERDISTGIQSWGDGATTYFSVDSSRFHIPLSTQSTSTTTGALRVASLGVTGAIFAGTVSANSYNLIPIGRGGGSLDTNTITGVSVLQANTTGIGLAGFGTGALQNNTTGNYSTAVGVSALLSNITGSSLTAAGLNALRSNTTGNNSSAFGVGALENNTTGNNLTASGVGALFSNITGSNLAGFGVGAGRFTSDGVTGLTISNNSCFFGANTKGTQNATNENVFCFNATGNGSNTVTIGDSSITNTYLRGVISTNSTTPSTSPTTGASVIPGGQGIGGNQYVGGFSSLGGDANHPGIKIKVLTGTTAATEGGVALIAHGVTVSKIVSVTVLVEFSANAFVLSGYDTQFVGLHFSVSVSVADIQIINHPTNSENILSKPVKITIIYTA
jgi:hypothetical protein